MGSMDNKQKYLLLIGLILGIISIIVCIKILWKWIGRKALLTGIPITLIDVDHFLFGNKGFLAQPEVGIKIFHLFHTIEVLLFVILLNFFTEIKNLRKGIQVWLFPNKGNCRSSIQYYYIWTVRILLFGVLIHYIMDLIIFSFGQKLNYFDYSIIHWMFSK